MKLRKFGAIAMAAALLIGIFASCQKKSTSGPSIKITNNDRKDINELTVADFGNPAEAKNGLKIFAIPAEGVKITKNLMVKISAKAKDGNTAVSSEKTFSFEKQSDGQYMAIVNLSKDENDKKGIGYHAGNFNEVEELTFSVVDENGKEGKKSIKTKKAEAPTPQPPAGTPLADLGTKYMNHINAAKTALKDDKFYGSFNESFGEVAASDAGAIIQNVSEKMQPISAKIKVVSGKAFKLGVVTVADFTKVTEEDVAKMTADKAELDGLKANDVVLLKSDDGNKFFLFKIDEINTEKIYNHTKKEVTDPDADSSKGYMKFTVKKKKDK